MDAETMRANGDSEQSIAYWQTRVLYWNGEPVTVRDPSPSYPMRPNELTPDGS